MVSGYGGTKVRQASDKVVEQRLIDSYHLRSGTQYVTAFPQS